MHEVFFTILFQSINYFYCHNRLGMYMDPNDSIQYHKELQDHSKSDLRSDQDHLLKK